MRSGSLQMYQGGCGLTAQIDSSHDNRKVMLNILSKRLDGSFLENTFKVIVEIVLVDW